jgi:hypothetical protein
MTNHIHGQQKHHSVIESFVNVVIGYGVSLTAQRIIFPMFGIYIGLSASLGIGAIFTVLSIIRSYILRRCFNAWHIHCAKTDLPIKETKVVS